MARIVNDEYKFTKKVEFTSQCQITGSGYHDITMFYNQPLQVGSAWVASSTGAMTLALNKSSTGHSLVFPLTGLKEGDIIQKFRVLGGAQAISGSATTVDACLWSNTKGTGADSTATSLGAITQVSVVADTAVDSEKDVTDVTVADDTQYFVGVDGNTANTNECAAFITGVEIDVKRIV
jgi:hypothetical protein